MSEEKKEKTCVWNLGTPCEGEISNRDLFDGQITVPICDKCYDGHNKIMHLAKFIDIDVVILLSDSTRNELYDAFKKVDPKPKEVKKDEEV